MNIFYRLAHWTMPLDLAIKGYKASGQLKPMLKFLWQSYSTS